MIDCTCRMISPTSIASTLGNSRTSPDSQATLSGPSGTRTAPSQVCGIVSSTPGGNSVKKFGRKLSQSTLRRLVIGAVTARAGDVVGQRVAELQPERPGDPLLHRQSGLLAGGGRPEGAGDDAIGRRHRRGPRQVELALGKASCPRVLETRRLQRLAVDRDEPAADHRIQCGVDAGARAQRRTHAVDLIGQHVDDEVVRRVGRQALPPVLHQVAAHDGEQQQRHQPQRQRADLQARCQRSPAQVGEAEAPGDAALRQALQQHDQQPRDDRRREQQTGDAADHDAGRLDVLRLPSDQQRDDRRAEPVGDERRSAAAAAGRGAARAAAGPTTARSAAAARSRTAAARRCRRRRRRAARPAAAVRRR